MMSQNELEPNGKCCSERACVASDEFNDCRPVNPALPPDPNTNPCSATSDAC